VKVSEVVGHAGRLARRAVSWFYLSEADVRHPSTHWTYLLICLFLTALPVLLTCPDPAHLALFGIPIPETCLSRKLFHSPCPGCGMTRSFVALTHGRFAESVAFHRLGIALYLFFVWQIIYRLYCIRTRCAHRHHRLLRFQSMLGLGMVVALLLNWAVGLGVGGN